MKTTRGPSSGDPRAHRMETAADSKYCSAKVFLSDTEESSTVPGPSHYLVHLRQGLIM